MEQAVGTTGGWSLIATGAFLVLASLCLRRAAYSRTGDPSNRLGDSPVRQRIRFSKNKGSRNYPGLFSCTLRHGK